jgi:hypothetical protein
MPQRYFDKFPVITYANNQAIDITRRVTVLDKIETIPFVYYPYEITDNERADQLSARYYDDQYKSWILYIVNKIVDPYYEWYLHEREMVDFLDKKYGSYYNAQSKIKHYVNNWVDGDQLTIGGYNALTPGMQRYWEPVFGSNGRTMSYKRKQIDWKTNTNKIVQYTVSNTSFIKDEICYINFSNENYGRGQVLSVSNNKVSVCHVSGIFVDNDDVSITSNSYIYGSESSVNTVFTSSNVVSSNIPAEEEAYWKAVTYLEFEEDKNEFNKTIRVLDNRLKQVAVDNLTDLLKE